jgi:hypothetical protein
MAQFGRKFDDRGLEALEDALTLPEQSHWWRDLLSLWYPSGQSTGDFGLRLAIRNLNSSRSRKSPTVSASRRGQSGDGSKPAISLCTESAVPSGSLKVICGHF